MNSGAALANRPVRLDGPDRLAVVGESPELPGWVRDWCRGDARELRTYRIPATARGRRSAPAHLLAAIAPLTADPVLLVPPDLGPGPADTGRRRVTATLHELPDDASVLAAALQTACHLGGPLVVVHGLPVSFAERSVGLGDALEQGNRLLAAANRWIRTKAPDLPVVTRLVRAHPHELVGEGLVTDLLVIGGPRRHVPDDLGLIACTAVQHATCPVLIVPR